MSFPPPATTAVPKKKSAGRTVLVVLACLVGFVVLIAAAGVAWVMFRPVNAGDFNSATSDWAEAVQPLDQVETLHSQVTDLTRAPDQSQQQQAIDSQHAYLDTLTQSLEDFGGARALKDDGFRTAFDSVLTSYEQTVQPMAADYVDNYPTVLAVEQACLAYDKDAGMTTIGKEMGVTWFDQQIAPCEEAVTAAAGSTSWAPYVQARQDTIDATRAAFTTADRANAAGDEAAYEKAVLEAYQQNNGARAAMAEGLTATAEQNNAIYTNFRAEIDAVTAYGTEHGSR